MHYLEGMRKSLAVLIVCVFLFSAFSVIGNNTSSTIDLIEESTVNISEDMVDQTGLVVGSEPMLNPRENS
ncbi:MAG: hypothetical protein KAJ33_07095, partial [Thermoplasmata archaeon]|nr:hypothetical protein [Thermoplasmata archaeon]